MNLKEVEEVAEEISSDLEDFEIDTDKEYPSSESPDPEFETELRDIESDIGVIKHQAEKYAEHYESLVDEIKEKGEDIQITDPPVAKPSLADQIDETYDKIESLKDDEVLEDEVSQTDHKEAAKKFMEGPSIKQSERLFNTEIRLIRYSADALLSELKLYALMEERGMLENEEEIETLSDYVEILDDELDIEDKYKAEG